MQATGLWKVMGQERKIQPRAGSTVFVMLCDDSDGFEILMLALPVFRT